MAQRAHTAQNGFKVNFKHNQYLSQVSSVPFFFTQPEMSRFFIPKIWSPYCKVITG
jgi:hypothetical protein